MAVLRRHIALSSSNSAPVMRVFSLMLSHSLYLSAGPAEGKLMLVERANLLYCSTAAQHNPALQV